MGIAETLNGKGMAHRRHAVELGAALLRQELVSKPAMRLIAHRNAPVTGAAGDGAEELDDVSTRGAEWPQLAALASGLVRIC